jgi:hypothetical protein
MKILFTLTSIKVKNDNYLISAKNLAKEIISKTNHDVLISTNQVDFFSDIKSNRCTVRDNIIKNIKLTHGPEFNYNLKHHAFKNIDEKYDFIVYLDCDIKMLSWSEESEDFFITTMKNFDFGADRLSCKLLNEVQELKKEKRCLFKHKIINHDILTKYSMEDDIMESLLPSEHFLILKNDPIKIKKFQQKWEEMDYHLQGKNCSSCSWGDGFEIGIAARYAGYHKTINLNSGYWNGKLGLQFNGNKI